ncbi:Oligoxyloglucan reducing end-specific cellobiohydrolase [Lenzites betulinus]|nr:Oligoxyloglucan reducing end-specific cellobiohydrolase [Lenzites betulinus]
MGLHHKAVVILWTIAWFLFSASAQPESSITSFEHLPTRLFFFDDSTDAIYHDLEKGVAYVSPDEGKTWSPAAGVPEGKAAMVFEHPFNNRVAFILSRSTTHYKTMDRGRTWQAFEMPLAPAIIGRPLSFHADPSKSDYILYQGTICTGTGWRTDCRDETYYTTDGFVEDSRLLLADVSRCQFAHSSKDFKHEAHTDLVYCVAFDGSGNGGSGHTLASSRLFSSTDFFSTEKKVEDLGIGKNARGIVAFAIVSKFAVVALKDLAEGAAGDMLLYVSEDTKTWAQGHFPHSTSARLRENAYTIVESTTHSLAVDVLSHDHSSVGTLFVSNSNGTFFVESLQDTNRNDMGYVDFENIYGVEGVGLANIVANAKDVDYRRAFKQLQTRITFDDGRTWSRLKPPAVDLNRDKIHCNPDNVDCSLHLHSVTLPHNFGRVFSSPAPGFVMGVGSIGEHLLPYEECDTFLSSDGGITWRMVRQDAHKYEFGDQGSILVTVNDEEGADSIDYSTDFGETWKTYKFNARVRARILTTVGDSTSQKFLLVGQVAKRDQKDNRPFAVVFLDFAPLGRRKCEDSDFEPWLARSSTHECLMGHKQSYRRRKQNADCAVMEKFRDPVAVEESCQCTKEDYECDYNFVKDDDKCVPVGPEPIPAGVCEDPTGDYMGSSGYRKIPGNTCDRERGLKLDERVKKPCSNARPAEGQIVHQTFPFPSSVVQFAYFRASTVILVRLADNSIWQSPNEGYTWKQLYPGETFVSFYHHKFTPDRAYLITRSKKHYYTTDFGKTWLTMTTPTVPNGFGLPALHFHPSNSEYLIWTGDEGCDGFAENCHMQSHYSLKNGRDWTLIDKYVRNCAWARDEELLVDPNQILCESYKNKIGNQRFFRLENPLELIAGTQFYDKKTKLFDHVVGFAKFSEYLIVAEYQASRQSLDIQVSLDGRNFAPGEFPPTMRPDQHAYTILESSTKSVFLHVTTSEAPAPYWGNILKSNSNGTYFGLSLGNVNRNDDGFVDFEKMINLDGIALVNVVGNPQEAPLTRRKLLQTRITHNDGGSWRALPPPPVDSHGNKYSCDTTKCSLHIHGYTERYDVRATFSTPSVPGLLMAVGNIGESLAPYDESDTFLSRDAGFTWEEVHKDAHLWEFGDSGSLLIMANDEGPTDHVMFSTDEGLKWNEYHFTDEPVRVKAIVTVPEDTSRRFILIGYYPRAKNAAVAVHLDFSAFTTQKCRLDPENPSQGDFELWSPSEEREEQCLFGKQTLYHRRKRNVNCVVGDQEKIKEKIVKHCQCTAIDFECEFNYHRNDAGECVLMPGLSPRAPDPVEQCRNGEEYWYDLTEYRKVPISACEGGKRIDRGSAHLCPGVRGHSAFFWFMMFLIPVSFAALTGYWYYRKGGYGRGAIRLPGADSGARYPGGDSGVLDTIASVPWFLLGVAGIAYEWVASRFDSLAMQFRGRGGYRNLTVDEDAHILRFEDEE